VISDSSSKAYRRFLKSSYYDFDVRLERGRDLIFDFISRLENRNMKVGENKFRTFHFRVIGNVTIHRENERKLGKYFLYPGVTIAHTTLSLVH
jgi:hypothetical protein